jgi:hypothetical protein
MEIKMNKKELRTKVNEVVGLLLELSDYIDTNKLTFLLNDILDCSYTGDKCELFNVNCNDNCKLIDNYLKEEFDNIKN